MIVITRGTVPPVRTAPPITQDRLRQGAELMAARARVIEEMQRYTLALDADLANGADVS